MSALPPKADIKRRSEIPRQRQVRGFSALEDAVIRAPDFWKMPIVLPSI